MDVTRANQRSAATSRAARSTGPQARGRTGGGRLPRPPEDPRRGRRRPRASPRDRRPAPARQRPVDDLDRPRPPPGGRSVRRISCRPSSRRVSRASRYVERPAQLDRGGHVAGRGCRGTAVRSARVSPLPRMGRAAGQRRGGPAGFGAASRAAESPSPPVRASPAAPPDGRRPCASNRSRNRDLDAERVPPPARPRGRRAATGRRRAKKCRRGSPPRPSSPAPSPRSRSEGLGGGFAGITAAPARDQQEGLASTLPLGCSGSASMRIEGDGHHARHGAPPSTSRNACAQLRRATSAVNHRRRPAACRRSRLPGPPRQPRAPTGCAASAASISPSSMRKPRILTW